MKNKASLCAEAQLVVGTDTFLDSTSPENSFAVIFEDNTETGYFYALDKALKGNPILDAMHIYNVANVIDGNIPSVVQIVWSADGLKAILLINNYPHAVFDFNANRGYCRTNFPSPSKNGWTKHDYEWTDDVMELFTQDIGNE